MPPTLRKRKAPEPAPAAAAPPPPKKAAAPKKTAAAAAPKKPAAAAATPKKAAAAAAAPKKETVAPPPPPPKKEAVVVVVEAEAKDAPAPATVKPSSKQVAVGDIISLDDFGGEIETNEGLKTTLQQLVAESTSGVVLFTYPKASTPGCTKQVCFFRDAYKPLTADGLAIYGLSADSPKANTTFRKNQKLPYPLLCDPDSSLIAAIGLKKNPKGTQRGVFVVDKQGKVLVAEAGSPQGTVDRVKALVEELKE